MKIRNQVTGWSIMRLLGLTMFLLVCIGCASSEKEVQRVAKDWCMTIRGSQVIPVYPLTEDLQPGDIFLVQVPIDQQQRLYKKNGFLALDNHLDRIDPNGYARFYDHSFFPKDETYELPRDWIRPASTNHSWQLAPHAAFPSYSFSVRNGAGMNLAVPVHGVPVGLSLLASDAASGTIEIKDAYTLGVDTISLYRQLQEWAAANADFLGHFGTSSNAKKTNFLRVVTRVYATGKMNVSLKDASNRSAGLDVGVPKPVNLLMPELPAHKTNTPETALKNYTNSWNAISEMVKAAGAATDATGKVLPGGSLRLAAASARSVSLDELFDPPIILGYLGFDCAILEGGTLGSPIPTHAVLDPKQAIEFTQFKMQFSLQKGVFETIQAAFLAADSARRTQIRQKASELGLVGGAVEEQNFIKTLRRSVDATDPVVTQKLKTLAEFSSQTQ